MPNYHNFFFPGGGSALLPAPVPPLTLDQVVEVTQLMSRNGATIHQLNTVRKNLELLKGGGLAGAASPAKVGNHSLQLALILSKLIVILSALQSKGILSNWKSKGITMSLSNRHSVD